MVFFILFSFLLPSLPLWAALSVEGVDTSSVEISADASHGQDVASLMVRPLMRFPQESCEHREAAALGEAYPQHFKGIMTINWQGLSELGHALNNNPRKPFLNSPPYMEDDSSFVRGGSIFDEAAQLYTTLSRKAVPDGAFLEEIFWAILVHAFEPTLTPREQALFAHLPNSRRHRTLKVLARRGIHWPLGNSVRHLGKELYGEHDLEERVTDVSPASFTSSRASGTLRDRLDEYEISTWPYLTTAPMTLADITYCFMHDVCPVGIIRAEEINPAHGGLGCAAFADHDLFHQHVAEEGRQFYPFVSRTLDDALKAGADGDAFLDEASTILWGRYKGVMGIYLHLFHRMLGSVAHDRDTFNIANVGLFFLMHEHPHFQSNVYDMRDPGQILDQHLDLVRRALLEAYADPDDVSSLKTSPTTGLSTLTSNEIFNILVPRLAEKLKEDCYAFQEYDDETGRVDMEKFRDFLRRNIRQASLERTEWRIDMIVTLKNGHEVHMGEVTNKLGVVVNDDYRLLLNMAGASIPKPQYGADESENHQTLKNHHQAMRQGIKSMLGAFKGWAHDQMTVGDFFTQYLHKAKTDIEGDYAHWYSFYKTAPQKTLVEPGIRTIIEELATQKPESHAVPFWMAALQAPLSSKSEEKSAV